MRRWCDPGYVTSLSSSGCVRCSLGQFAVRDDCRPCPVGSYQDSLASVTCITCPSGSSTLTQGSVSRSQCKQLCPAGSYSSSTMVPCYLCPAGYYQDEVGSTKCKTCPSATTTLQEGAIGEQFCKGADISYDGSSSTILSSTAKSVHLWVKPTTNKTCLLISLDSKPVLLLNVNDSNDPFFYFGQGVLVPVPQRHWMSVTLTVSDADVALYLDGNLIEQATLSFRPAPLLSILGKYGCKGLYSRAEFFSTVLTEVDIHSLSDKCDSPMPGDVLSWNDVISNTTLTPYLTESTCDDVDGCASNPCSNHGRCEDTFHGFQCHCTPGYEGELCDVKTRFCLLQNDCRNGATCKELETNYTCSCADGFTGTYCESHIVDGKWSKWSDWEDCSASCGTGVQKRYRHCSPPINGGKPCSDESEQSQSCGTQPCPSCIELKPPRNGNLSCTEENGDMTCSPYCRFGQTFISEVKTNYTCGPSTNFLWTDQLSVDQDAMTLPGCTAEELPNKLRGTMMITYPSLDCSAQQKAQESVKAQLSNLPCARTENCSINTVWTEKDCDTKKRSVEGVSVEVTMERAVEYAPPIVNFPEDGSPVNITLHDVYEFAVASGNRFVEIQRALENDAQSIQDDIVHGHYNIITGVGKHAAKTGNVSLAIVCSDGMINAKGNTCTACPAGTYEEGGYCRKCPIGGYQDEEGRTSCKPCLEGKSTSVPGSMARTDCKVLCRAGSFLKNSTASASCAKCPLGTYQPYSMQTFCYNCPEGSSTLRAGSVDISSCFKSSSIQEPTQQVDTSSTGMDESSATQEPTEQVDPAQLTITGGIAAAIAIGIVTAVTIPVVVCLCMRWKKKTDSKSANGSSSVKQRPEEQSNTYGKDNKVYLEEAENSHA